jgi:hypothetical protein
MRATLAVFILLASAAARGEDQWVILGEARGAGMECRPFHTWRAVAVAHNFAAQDAMIRIVETTNGVTPAVQAVGVPADTSVQLPSLDAAGSVPIFVARLDVPAGIRVESRLEYRYDNPCLGAPPAPGPAGKIELPLFRALRTANEQQIHLGSDLGMQAVRVNVGVYNGGDVVATATIEVRRPACGRTSSTFAEIRVPAHDLLQVSLPQPALCSGGNALVPSYVTYTLVRADQPALSYVTPVSNEQGPAISFAVAAQ